MEAIRHFQSENVLLARRMECGFPDLGLSTYTSGKEGNTLG